nr:MFS transporter [Streptomyces sp. NRRL S-337]
MPQHPDAAPPAPAATPAGTEADHATGIPAATGSPKPTDATESTDDTGPTDESGATGGSETTDGREVVGGSQATNGSQVTGGSEVTGRPQAPMAPPRTRSTRTRSTGNVRAPLTPSAVALLLVLAVTLTLTNGLVLGSRLLRGSDSTLLPYAVAAVFFAIRVAYRHTLWGSEPLARGLLRQGRHPLISRENFRKAPTALPQLATTYLGSLKFLGARSATRWAAHQLAFRGFLFTGVITFPLAWGWFTFPASTGAGAGAGPGYEMRLWGPKALGFLSSDAVGRAVFHGLDLAAGLVIAGAGHFLWSHLHDRTAGTRQRFAYEVVPLLPLLAVSVTGLRLTFPAPFLRGGADPSLALRPTVFKYAARKDDELFACRHCGTAAPSSTSPLRREPPQHPVRPPPRLRRMHQYGPAANPYCAAAPTSPRSTGFK